MDADPQSTVDEYLTRIARKAWPNASVTVRIESNGSKYYQLEVPGEKPLVLGNVFGPARVMLRAVVFEHLPPEANRAHFTLDVRVIDDAKKPGEADLARASQIGASLRDESSSRADAVLAGKLLVLGTGGGAFTLEDIRALRRHGSAKGAQGNGYEQLADALARWTDFGD